MKKPIQHWASNLTYLRQIEIVEERKGNTSLVPHTDQLPQIARALKLEFLQGLPTKLANTDHRADDYRKLLLALAAQQFCWHVRDFRNEHLWPYPVLDPDLIAQIAVVQQITQAEHLGNVHSYRLYTNDGFLPEVLLDGRSVQVSSHVLDRYTERVCGGRRQIGSLLAFLWRSSKLLVRVNHSGDGIAVATTVPCVFPYELHNDRLLLLTCLTANEVRSIEFIQPLQYLVAHFATTGPPDLSGAGEQIKAIADSLLSKVASKGPFPSMITKPSGAIEHRTWHQLSRDVSELAQKLGLAPGKARIGFRHNTYGPTCEFNPCDGQAPLVFNY